MYDSFPAQLLDYHRSMLTDEFRMRNFLRAILQVVRPGDVVLDIGSGTGILAYFACLAGARKVYAVEEGEIVEVAKAVCRHNGLEDRVTFIDDISTNITLPELADVLISETIGNIGFEEGILGWVLDARKRLLVEDARIIPSAVRMYVAPVERPRKGVYLANWQRSFYTFDFTPAHETASNHLQSCKLHESHLLGEAKLLASADLSSAINVQVDAEQTFTAERDGSMDGLGAWFEADLAEGISISTAPPNPTESWSNIFFPLSERHSISAGDQISVHIRSRENSSQWEWQVSAAKPGTNGSNPAVRFHASGSTETGEMYPDRPRSATVRPTRNFEAEIDLFILRRMDGKMTQGEIADALTQEFVEHFNSNGAAQDRVQEVVDGYSRTNPQ